MAEEEGKRLAGLHASAEQAAEAQLHGQVLQREHENTEDQLFGLQQPMDEQQLTAKRSALQKDGADVWAQVAQHLQRHTQQFAGGLATHLTALQPASRHGPLVARAAGGPTMMMT